MAIPKALFGLLLPARQEPTRYGRLPGKQLTEDLQAWDDWFRAEGAALRIADLQ